MHPRAITHVPQTFLRLPLIGSFQEELFTLAEELFTLAEELFTLAEELFTLAEELTSLPGEFFFLSAESSALIDIPRSSQPLSFSVDPDLH